MVVDQSKIEEKVLIYKKLFKSLLKKCKIAKSKIDVFHCTLYKINSVIQLTVILFSATSTFLQALMPGNRNGDIIISNSTDLVSEETLEDENYINNKLKLVDGIISDGLKIYNKLLGVIKKELS